jgi:putative ABC transporter-associated repeat protein
VVVLDRGHVDYAARVADGGLVSQVKDGTRGGEPVWRDPADVVFHLPAAAETEVPPGGRFSFLGEAGAPVWQIPQTQDPDVVWLGWNTEEIARDQVSGAVTWRLDEVDGPGEVAVYELDSFGQPRVILDGAGDSYGIPVGTHAHGNWAFTEEGAYRLTFTHTARLASGETVRDTATVAFAVGSTDPQSLARSGGSGRSAPAAATPGAATTTTEDRTTATAAGGDCRLPRTGGDIGRIVLVGVLLVLAGAACVLVARRRNRTPTART